MYRIIWKSENYLMARSTNHPGSTMIVTTRNGVRHMTYLADQNIEGAVDVVDSVLNNQDQKLGDFILYYEFTGHLYDECKCAENAHLIPE
jgi:hypothetical protein